MDFEVELQLLKMKIKDAEDVDELDYLRRTNEKKYWWTNIFLTGLFYGLNGKVGKMILSWFISPFTLGIYHLYLIYTAHKDQEEFNATMEHVILKRKEELKNVSTNIGESGTVIEIPNDMIIKSNNNGITTLENDNTIVIS